MLRLTLKAQEDQTLLQITDCLMGKISQTLSGELESGWRQIFEDGLKVHAESR